MATRELGVRLQRNAPRRLPEHPGGPGGGHWRRWALDQPRPLAIDLFAGCGGLSLGLADAGFSVVFAVDNDGWAVETHRHNLPAFALEADLADPGRLERLISLFRDLPIDLVAGGPPCQPFSRAGKSKIRSLVEEGVRPAEDLRAELWRPFVEIVRAVKPRAVLIENVPDMALADDLLLVRRISEELESSGYEVHARIVDASQHGVPQHRQRLFLVGLAGGLPFRWPAPERPVPLRAAIGDLPPLGTGTGSAEMPANPPRSAFQRHARRGMNGQRVVWDHVTRPVREDDRRAFSMMRPGTRYSDLPEELRRYRDDIFRDKYNRLAWDTVSRSITAHIAKDGYWYVHPEEDRTLTVREAARIQTFPDHFRFAGTRSHAFRQIGNAVPPILAEKLGRAIRDALSAGETAESGRSQGRVLPLFRERLLDWAASDRRRAPWRHPGDPWAVLCGVVLADRQGAEDSMADEFLRRFPKVEPDTWRQIERAAKELDDPWRRRYRDLAAAARRKVGEKGAGVDWIEGARVGGGDLAFVRSVGFGDPTIPVTAATLRVASRLRTPSATKLRRTDARVAIGRMMGLGAQAPALAAALNLLGRAVCPPRDPECDQCPVSEFCPTRSSPGGQSP